MSADGGRQDSCSPICIDVRIVTGQEGLALVHVVGHVAVVRVIHHTAGATAGATPAVAAPAVLCFTRQPPTLPYRPIPAPFTPSTQHHPETKKSLVKNESSKCSATQQKYLKVLL